MLRWNTWDLTSGKCHKKKIKMTLSWEIYVTYQWDQCLPDAIKISEFNKADSVWSSWRLWIFFAKDMSRFLKRSIERQERKLSKSPSSGLYQCMAATMIRLWDWPSRTRVAWSLVANSVKPAKITRDLSNEIRKPSSSLKSEIILKIKLN